MDRFVRDLLSLPALSAGEEAALAVLARSGDRDARAALITSGLRSVALHACMRGLAGEELRDAVQSGAIGLIRAVDRFDPDRGARLATYAWRWVAGEMASPARPEVPLGDIDGDIDGAIVGVAPPLEAAVGGVDLLDGMPDELVLVLRHRFGLGEECVAPQSRRAVSERLGVSEGRVRRLEDQAMRHLRRRLAKVVDRAPPAGGADPL